MIVQPAPTAPTAPSDRLLVRSLAVTYRSGSSLSEHDHAWAQLVYAVSGVMRVEVASVVWLVPSTRAIWLPPRHAHRIHIRGEVAMRTLYLAPKLARRLPRDLRERARSLEVSALLRELILHVLQLAMLDAEVPAHARLAAVLVDLIERAPETDLRLPLPRDPRALAAAEHLQAQPELTSDLHQLARRVGASLRTLQRLFTAETGLSLDTWRQKARLTHAVSCLCSGTTVSETALACGYDSPSAFIAAFRRQFGVTPGRFRTRAG